MGRVGFFALALTACSLTGPSLDVGFAFAQGSFQDEIANLRSPNVDTRVRAAKALGKSGRLEAIPSLTEAMRDPELKVRKVTVLSLRSYTALETIDGLLIGLGDEERGIRREALTGILELYVGAGNAEPETAFSWVLGDRKRTPGLKGLVSVDPRVVTGVSERLQDEEPSLRSRAAYTLGVLGAESSVSRLSASLYDGEKSVRRETVGALAKIGTDEAGEALRGALGGATNDLTPDVVDALGHMQYKPAAPQLVTIYDANTNKLGERALAALARMGAEEARGVFYYQMTSSNPDQRRYAVEGLGRMGDAGMVPGLIKDFLREPDPSVQLAYCFSLASLGRTEFVDRIVLDLGNKKRRVQASGYAVELGDDLLDELISYLSDPVPAVRGELAQVLMEVGDPAAIPHLQPLLSDPDRDVADRANRAIARLQQGLSTTSTAAVR